MRRKTAVTGLLFMGVLVAAATLGLVYGSWAETININGSVRTGTVNVNYTPDACQQIDPVTGECIVPNPSDTDLKGKNVSDCTLTVDGNKVALAVTNGYPGYRCKVWGSISNKGTLPVVTGPKNFDVDPGLEFIFGGAGKGDCRDDQLNSGEFVFCDFEVVVNKLAPQGVKLTFSFDVNAVLLNKPAAAPQ